MHESPARPDDLLPMRLVSERTGLSPDVLRAWERRYGVVAPGRSPGGQRWYTASDVARLRLLARAVEAGRNIASVAHLADDALTQLVRGEEAAALARQTPHAFAAQPYLADALAAVESLDGTALETTLRTATLRLSTDELLDGVIAPLVRSTGDRWHDGTLSPAHEHLATAAVRRLLGWLTDQYAPAPGAPALLVTTPAGQWHELGAALVAATAAAAGWQVVYLGPNLPASDIADAAAVRRVRAVALSVVFPEDDPLMDGELKALRAALPAEVRVVVGGRAVPAYQPSLDAIGATAVHDLPSLRIWLVELATS
ncbi:MAG: cobalamin B12-binding domain-containing protein [Gemmatimonadetes bacterium]|nr:cobalamin B12-binding domain-containing protein [Gemmatimonadota bacterium]